MKSLVQEKLTTLSNFAVLPALSTRSAAIHTSPSTLPNLHWRVTHLADSISDEGERIIVSKVLADLVFLLDYLGLVDAAPRDPSRLSERRAILETVRSESFALVEFIENRLASDEEFNESLREALDGLAYAIKHEVKRIFDGELARISGETDELKVHGLLLYAHGVLTNCFQQCMIGLARLFDDGVTGDRLFEDWRVKRERSLRLYRDLEALTKMLQRPEIDSLDEIAQELESFQEGSMQWLMYKDWHEYQALAEPIIASITRGETPLDLLHRLGCYLETLLAHVRARGVLADLIFEPCHSTEQAPIFS